MSRRINCKHTVLAVSLAVGSASPGVAAILSPGQSASLGGTAISSDPSLAGTIIAESTTTFSALAQVGVNQFQGQLFTADLYSTVVRETASGTLDFYYQVINNNNYPVDPVRNIIFAGFTQLTVDGDYRTDQGGLYDPTAASRDTNGFTITFDFTPTPNAFVSAGATAPLLIRTNAIDFLSNSPATINFNGIEGEGAPPVPAQAIVPSYAPLPLPEPSSLALFSITIGCLFRRSKQRRR